MQIFRTKPTKGTPLRTAGIWEGIRKMARAWETLDVQNGYIDWSFGRPTVVVHSGGAGGEGGGGRVTWNGIIWIGNHMINVLDDYDLGVFNLTGDPPLQPSLIGWNAQMEWYGWVRGEYLVVRTDADGEYDDTEYGGEYEGLCYRFTDDYGDWSDPIEKAFCVAEEISLGFGEKRWRLMPRVAHDIHLIPSSDEWTGRVIVAGGQIHNEDFSEDENWPLNVTNKWIRIPVDGSPCTFVPVQGEDLDVALYRQVAKAPGVLSNNTQGDIVIDYVPYYT